MENAKILFSKQTKTVDTGDGAFLGLINKLRCATLMEPE
jgi:hypothetical protein